MENKVDMVSLNRPSIGEYPIRSGGEVYGSY